MSKDRLISEAYEAFSSFSRPEHFTNHTHCEECKEHDETMRACSLRSLGAEQVGNPGWSPLPFLTEQAFGYVMPRLLELALTSGTNGYGEPFIFPYLLALTPAPEHRSFESFSSAQAAVVLESIHYIQNQLASQVESECCESNLAEAIVMWEKLHLTLRSRGRGTLPL